MYFAPRRFIFYNSAFSKKEEKVFLPLLNFTWLQGPLAFPLWI